MKKLVNIISKNDIKITKMSTEEGNHLLTTLIRNTVELTLKKTSRSKIVSRLKNGLEQINKENPEVYEQNVRNEMFYFLDNVFNQVGYDEIDIDELF